MLEPLLVAGGTLLQLWIWVPPLLSWLGCAAPRIVVYGTPSDFSSNDPLDDDYLRQLAALGFEPLGMEDEIVWLFGPHWRFRCRKQVLASHKLQALAHVYRFFSREMPRVGFASLFSDRVYLWTSAQEGEENHRDDEYVSQSFGSRDLAAVWAKHQQAADELRSQGLTAQSVYQLEDAAQASRFSARTAHARTSYRGLGRAMLVLYGTIAGLMAFGLGAFRGLQPPWGLHDAIQILWVLGLSLLAVYYFVRFSTAAEGRKRAAETRARLANEAQF